MKKAFITGVTGQDGSYLAELLLEKGYEVHGMIRRSSSFNTGRIRHVFQEVQAMAPRFVLHYGDLADGSTIARLVRTIAPDEIYNLGAQSHVRTSFDIPEYTADVVALGTLRLLDAIRETGLKTRLYQASSSEMFGNTPAPQHEKSGFFPVSPYATAKLFAHQMTLNYRHSYGLYAVSGILFNHESPRRGETFVTRKITRRLAQILKGEAEALYLGNLEARRDWGYAKEYVEAIWRMLQQEKPEDYVIATGETHSVREFLDEAFSLVGLDWQRYVKIDSRYFRPMEVDVLQGDARKAREELGWQAKTPFRELVKIMVTADLRDVGLDPQKFLKR